VKASTGIEKLDEEMDGGMKSNSVLLLTDTLVDKASFAQHILSTRIKEGDKGIYLTTSKPPAQILESMYDHGFRNKNIVFIDCISNTLGQKSKEKYSLKTKVTDVKPAFEETVELLKKVLKETRGVKFVVFDCLETFMGLGSDIVAKKIQEIKDVAEDSDAICLFLFTNWGYSKNEIEKIRNSIKEIIDLGTIEKKASWLNYFTVSQKPKIFFVITATGVNLYIPKILITGPFHSGKSSITKALSERSISVDRLGTTVSLDHGYIERSGMACDLFGTPGQERFDWILKILARDIWGIILIVDSTRPETFGRAIEMLESVKRYGVAFIVFANKQDMPEALKPEKIKQKLGLPDVIGTSAVTKKGLEDGLKILFDKIFKSTILINNK
jgi:small GTP-binding protein